MSDIPKPKPTPTPRDFESAMDPEQAAISGLRAVDKLLASHSRVALLNAITETEARANRAEAERDALRAQLDKLKLCDECGVVYDRARTSRPPPACSLTRLTWYS